jgi:hypothetical protein
MTKITNRLDLPDAIVRAVSSFADDYDRGDSDATVTELIGPPQLATLRRQHETEIVEDASERIWSLLGQVVHDILRRANVSALVENRLYTESNGWKVSGQYDRIALLAGTAFSGLLQDYKVASVWEYIMGVKPERVQQLNLLAELARRNGYNIAGLEAVFIFRDWKMSEARRNPQYPQTQVVRSPLPLWTQDQAHKFLDSRVLAHQHARDLLAQGKPLPPCSEEERWARTTTWAVMKPGVKRATKLCETRQEAERVAAGIKGAFVQCRIGESVRCVSYCSVSEFCPQFQAIRQETPASAELAGEEE